MIRFNAASAGAYWERLLALPLGERRVAGREPPSELRSEGQPGYSGGSLLHLHLHRAPITLPSLRISRLRISGLPTVGLWVPRVLGLWVSGLWIPWRLCISRLLTGSAMDRECLEQVPRPLRVIERLFLGFYVGEIWQLLQIRPEIGG